MSKKSIFIVLITLVIGLVILFSILKRTSAVVTVERSFNAPIDKVWMLWKDPESIKKWWSPKDFTAPVIENDFRQDGTFLFSMKSPDGKMFWNVGKYTEIIPNQKVTSTLSFSDETGKVVPASHYGLPGEWPTEVTVTVQFKEIDGKTQVTVQEIGIPTIMYVFAKMGWQQQFDKFEKLLK
jgi:uncharacterized protein YndB with AHSA1/START domain